MTSSTVEAQQFIAPKFNGATAEKLAKLGIRHAFDLVLHLPMRFEDETHLTPIAHARHGALVQVEGEVVNAEVKFRPRRQLVAQVEDGSGTLVVRLLNFYPSQIKQFRVGARVRLLGEVRSGFFGAEMVHPRCRVVSEDMPLPEALTPVYPTTAGLSQTTLRKLIAEALDYENLSDTLPGALIGRLKLSEFDSAVRFLHNPPPDVSQHALDERTHPAWRRLKFDELLAQQISMRLHYRNRIQQQAPALNGAGALRNEFIGSLPFPLTGAQQRCVAEIGADLGKGHPMRRLLQGDVGSGKTVVAAVAALQAIESGYQAALMAPTEILAEQHFRKLTTLLVAQGVTVVWLTGSLKKKEKQAALESIASGVAQLAIGTHALFQEDVTFAKLGLAIVDEQHRFGVAQRLALRLKGSTNATHIEPHQLMMSATPIPRTLSMSYYADLDVSIIDELPPGRTPVVTKLVADNRRDQVIARVRDACLSGAQAYWVCPLIEESEALQLQTAIDTFETIQVTFPDLKVGLIHGRMKTSEKSDVMARFLANDIQLLVATTVIEVGVDVPNASLMVIEHAERMGLSQLHQLRGRVGRGSTDSVCILLYQAPLSETARARLKVIYENTDGFEIARADLQLRGPGEFLGSRQSGMPMLRFADINLDIDLLDAARDTAEWLIREHPEATRAHLDRWLGNKEEFLKV
ncbi:MAG TPA: ATP-dependent DNA helicase RecG [Burkholderiales bacterium]|nr:ATP-dependent DNA helicase RecG [Burkholderiales bacterium]